MQVAALKVRDFRSYIAADIEFRAGKIAIIGPNGHGKTNLVEAIEFLSSLESHRVASNVPLVRHGSDGAMVAARVHRSGRAADLQAQIVPSQPIKTLVNGAALPRAREMIGILRTIVFSPEDLGVIKGDPGGRRKFLDQFNAIRIPRLGGVRSDYDRVLRQRNALLKSARGMRNAQTPSTLQVWDEHLAEHGGELIAARVEALHLLSPYLEQSYGKVAALAAQHRQTATANYSSPTETNPERSAQEYAQLLMDQIQQRRGEELDRGITLVGPHRDEIELVLGELPARGYASHGETWSFALALRLATFELLRADGDDPVLILDDVFAELDAGRREHLADLVGDVEQVIVTAADPSDVPELFNDQRIMIEHGQVTHD